MLDEYFRRVAEEVNYEKTKSESMLFLIHKETVNQFFILIFYAEILIKKKSDLLIAIQLTMTIIIPKRLIVAYFFL